MDNGTPYMFFIGAMLIGTTIEAALRRLLGLVGLYINASD